MILKLARTCWNYSNRFREPYKTRWLLNSIKHFPHNARGEVRIGKWIVEYIDANSLSSMWNLQFLRRYNDFYTSNNRPRILDCGSNIGVSVLRYKHLYPNSQITAFEPDPALSEVLRKNIQQNHLTDVRVVEAAVWSQEAQLQFVSFAHENSQAGHLNSEANSLKSAATISVPAIWLGDYLNEEIDFLKLDIEGAELTVLESCKSQLSNVLQMIIEVHYRVDQPQMLIRILEILKEAGFKIAVYQIFGPPSFNRFVRNEKAAADQFPILWAWRD